MTASKRYNDLVSTAKFYDEYGFCSVVALALAVGISFEEAWSVMKQQGRKANSGATVYQIEGALKALGVKFSEPRVAAKTVKNFNYRGNYIILTCNHALCHQFGETLDHSAGSKRRIKWVYKIEEIPKDIKSRIVLEKVITNPKKPRKPRKSTYRWALVNPKSQEVYKLYKRKPSRKAEELYVSGDESTMGILRYVEYNEEMFKYMDSDPFKFWDYVNEQINK